MVEAVSPEQQIEALRRELAQRDAVIAASQAELAEAALLKARLTTALLEIERIKMQLAVLRRQRYGQSSERLDRDIDQLELRLEDLEADCGEQAAATGEIPEPNAGPKPSRKPSGRKPLPAHLPREVVVHEPEIACVCGSCDPTRLTKLGETTTEVLDKIPARLKVIQHVRPKYACRVCEKVFWPRRRRCRSRRAGQDRGCWRISRSRSIATASRSIGSRASSAARASRSIAPPWRSGSGTWPGGCARWPS